MNNKSILVDIDETTKNIMSSIKSDIKDDICLDIYGVVQETSDKINSTISNAENNLVVAVKEALLLTEKCNKALKDIQVEVEDISDNVASLDGIDKISSCATVLSNTVGTLNSTLADIARTINDSRMEMLQQMSALADGLRQDVSKKSDSLTRKVDEISLSVSQKLDKGMVQLNADRENDNRILLQRVDNLDGRINALDVKVCDLISGVSSTMADRHKEISDMISKLSAEIASHSKKSEIAHSDNRSVLDKILYTVTPFWKRNKSNNE